MEEAYARTGLITALFYCLLDLRSGECNVVSLYVYVVQSRDLFVLCVACSTEFVNCWLNNSQYDCVCLLLNVMELLSVVGGTLLDRPCMVSQRMCVLCMWSQ